MDDLRPFLFAEGRRSPEEVEAAIRRLAGHSLLTTLLEATEIVALVLNEQRQILLANSDALGLARAGALTELQGQRPGEVLGCERAWEHPDGCGASPNCASCGVARAILSSQRGAPLVTECLLTITRPRREAREFQVKATPLSIDGVSLTVVSLRDISAEKRRDALERVFFHDLLNTVTGLHGYARLLLGDEPPRREFLERIALLSQRLCDEVNGQRALLAAEGGTLALELEEVRPAAILGSLGRSCGGFAAGRVLRYVDGAPDRGLHTDRTLLARVLVNMVKNACEATPAGGSIELCAEERDGHCRFRVWNPGAIPPRAASQIFKRSFSTKEGRGRGLGTYSMKLFGERYLGGRVDFASAEPEGTSFWIDLPWQGPAPDGGAHTD